MDRRSSSANVIDEHRIIQYSCSKYEINIFQFVDKVRSLSLACGRQGHDGLLSALFNLFGGQLARS